jgi:hypothetical protein
MEGVAQGGKIGEAKPAIRPAFGGGEPAKDVIVLQVERIVEIEDDSADQFHGNSSAKCSM